MPTATTDTPRVAVTDGQEEIGSPGPASDLPFRLESEWIGLAGMLLRTLRDAQFGGVSVSHWSFFTEKIGQCRD